MKDPLLSVTIFYVTIFYVHPPPAPLLGADVVFVGALESVDAMKRLVVAVPRVPKMANMLVRLVNNVSLYNRAFLSSVWNIPWPFTSMFTLMFPPRHVCVGGPLYTRQPAKSRSDAAGIPLCPTRCRLYKSPSPFYPPTRICIP